MVTTIYLATCSMYLDHCEAFMISHMHHERNKMIDYLVNYRIMGKELDCNVRMTISKFNFDFINSVPLHTMIISNE